MLYSPANLLAVGVADKKGALNCVFLAEDGSTFATDRMCLVVVEPCKSTEEFRAPGVEPIDVRENGIAVPAKLVADTLRVLPKQPMRQVHKNAALTRCDAVIEFSTTSDGVAVKRNSSTRARTGLPKVKSFLQQTSGEEKAEVCVNLKRLKKLVDTLDKMCGGDDSQPLFLEVGGEHDPVVVRTQSYLTGQRLIGALTALDVERRLKHNKWERKLYDEGVVTKKKPKTGKKELVRRRNR